MIIVIIIFFISVILAFGMLVFRAWQLRTGRVAQETIEANQLPEFSFRQVEKYMLYLTKRAIQWVVLIVVKYWFIAVTKTKKWVAAEWPKIHSFFVRTPKASDPARPSYVRRAVVESKIKIRRMKEKVKKEHAEQVEEKQEETEMPL
jgi:hypothetical protein